MLLEINRKLLARSDRVKSLDIHPSEPWLIAGLYTGNVIIYHIDTGVVIKTFEVTEVPVRCVRFIARRNWFICGSDDFHLRVFNYNTGEKVTALEAHPDYIRCLAVHPTQSLVLTGSDDMTIKLWDWEKGWKCIQVSPRVHTDRPTAFSGHTHYIMNLSFNPKDANTFASACLDRTVKVWSLGSATANFTLDAHEKGVNYVEYYHGGDKPYLVTTGDDRQIKIWDYLSKSCIQTLEGHSSNVSFAIFHPSLPILISGSEDGTVKIWHSSTYRLENTLDYGLERVWCIAYSKKGNDVAFGFDEGAVVVKLGREEPSISMDGTGKVVFTRNAEVLTATMQSAVDDNVPDGQQLAVAPRELGNTEVYAQSLQHSPNGRFVTVCGDGEYIIYTALAWRNKSFGPGVGFAWALDSNTYAVREANSKIKVFRNFKERPNLVNVGYTTDGIYGGTLLGVKGMGFVVFYDWDSGAIVRRIEVDVRNVYWSGTGNFVAIAGADSFYVLKYDRDAYLNYVESGNELDDEGVEEAFDVEADIADVVRTGKWIGDCFVYTTDANRLNYAVGGQIHNVTHFDSQMYLLGYLPSHNRIYLCDKGVNFYAFSLSLSVIEYQTAILRGDLEAASEVLPTVAPEQRNRLARFLETQDLKELALQVSTDPDHKFDLAIQLDDLDTALALARTSPHLGSQPKWRTVGDRALASWKIQLAEECFKMANDLSALLLIYTSTGDRQGLSELKELASTSGLNNIAFACALQLSEPTACVDVLLAADRAPEAALFSRTYAPSQTSKAVAQWRKTLEQAKKPKQASAIADPVEHVDEFGGAEVWEMALEREKEDASILEQEIQMVEQEAQGLLVDVGEEGGQMEDEEALMGHEEVGQHGGYAHHADEEGMNGGGYAHHQAEDDEEAGGIGQWSSSNHAAAAAKPMDNWSEVRESLEE
ncbi:BZ3500_MvSof-1268-A1-R1_Chr5-2g08039 [Microbotryum saponariae]|uniref:Coatomer subunit beta' n=1 Tax=Microbotryum saponariae TaxID=289078 RepID=A0A2X0LL65_9BASI|nr:BZ3500_MvSof-1268-A1-R1_Chr5-2g08039 [Microbotryum saponariae]SDA05908.1 BZ3501_MvSof-1269-A2-R1_Chr5-2g07861 [Microbotryum saponariae]